MSVLIPWEVINSPSIDNYPQMVRSGLNAAREFACDLYRRYPGFMSNSGPYDPLAGLKRGIWDRICPTDLPPVPTNPPPWGGDTCACALYTVNFRRSGGGQAPVTSTIVNVRGPIYGLRRDTPSPGAQRQFLQSGNCVNGVWTGQSETQVFFGSDQFQFVISNVIRTDGGTTCNPPQPSPPPPPPQPIAPEDQERRSPITVAPNVTVNVPVILVRPTVNVDLNPSVEINVGPLNFNFDLGGVTVGINPSFNPTIFAPTVNLPGLPGGRPRPPALPPSGGNCPDPCEPTDLTPVINRLEQVKKYVRRPKTVLNAQGLGSGNSGTFNLPPRTKFVTVDVTVAPANVRVQSGGGQAPNVQHQGWSAIGRGSKFGERIPLSYGANVYPVPVECDSFSFTLYAGGVASVGAIVESDLPECQEYECG